MKQLGKFHIALDKIDSTNNYAMLLIKNEEFSKKNLPEEGTVITANYQWQGRGQQGANWHSELGLNLMASYILYPNFLPFNQLFALSQAIALGCLHCLKQFTAKTVCIKWPNDLFVEDKKIGGILIENIWQGNNIYASVVGIGLNINQICFPDEIASRTTSLALLSQPTLDPVLHVLPFLNHFTSKFYSLLYQGEYNILHQNYLQFLYRFNKLGQFRANGQEFTAKLTGVRSSGHLELTLLDGQTQTFEPKQLQWL